MPNRILREPLLKSRKYNTITPPERDLYVRILLLADDFGRFDGDSVIVSREAYPIDESMNSRRIEPMLNSLADVGLIALYIVNGERYIQITNWQQRSRAECSKFPDPAAADHMADGGQPSGCQMKSIRLTKAHEDVDEDADGAEGDLGAGDAAPEEGTPFMADGSPCFADDKSSVADDKSSACGQKSDKFGDGENEELLTQRFNEFWQVYPKKVAKKAAYKAWRKLRPREALVGEIMKGLTRWGMSPQWADTQFIPNAATFLNGERWLDEPPVFTARPEERTKRSAGFAEMAMRGDFD